MDNLYDSMAEQMNQQGFTVGDKYQAKYDELGKTTTTTTTTIEFLPLHTLLGFISLYLFNMCLIFGQS